MLDYLNAGLFFKNYNQTSEIYQDESFISKTILIANKTTFHLIQKEELTNITRIFYHPSIQILMKFYFIY